MRRCGRSGHASPLAVACGGTRGPKRWLTSGVRPLPSGGLRRASIKKASSTRGGRGPYFLCPAGKNPLPWGGQCRTVVPSFHDCAPWGMAGLPAWFPCSGLPVSSGARWSKVKNLTAAGPLPFFTGFPFQAGLPGYQCRQHSRRGPAACQWLRLLSTQGWPDGPSVWRSGRKKTARCCWRCRCPARRCCGAKDPRAPTGAA